MYSTLDLVIMGLLVALNLSGTIIILNSIDQRREYVRVGEGLRLVVLQLAVTGYVLWFGYIGRTMDVGELMTILTWSLVALRTLGVLSYMGVIENPRAVIVRSRASRVWVSISSMAQLWLFSLMFGLALAYGT